LARTRRHRPTIAAGRPQRGRRRGVRARRGGGLTNEAIAERSVPERPDRGATTDEGLRELQSPQAGCSGGRIVRPAAPLPAVLRPASRLELVLQTATRQRGSYVQTGWRRGARCCVPCLRTQHRGELRNETRRMDQRPPPRFARQRAQIFGGGGLKITRGEWGNPEGPALCSSTAVARASLLVNEVRAISPDVRSSRSTCGPAFGEASGPEQYADGGNLWADDVARLCTRKVSRQTRARRWS